MPRIKYSLIGPKAKRASAKPQSSTPDLMLRLIGAAPGECWFSGFPEVHWYDRYLSGPSATVASEQIPRCCLSSPTKVDSLATICRHFAERIRGHQLIS